MAIESELLKIINDDLPNQVGAKLKERLEKAEQDAERVKNLREDITNKDNTISELKRQKQELQASLDKTLVLLKNQEEVDERARGFNLEIANLKQKAAENSQYQLLELVKLVFRSPVYTHHLTESGSVPVAVPASGYANVMAFNTAKTVTTQET